MPRPVLTSGRQRKLHRSLLPESATGEQRNASRGNNIKKYVSGFRSGPFERLLRFSNVVLFGAKDPIRLHGDFKRGVKDYVERVLVQILVDARQRRIENKGRSLVAANIAGAFTTWAQMVKPSLVAEYARVSRLFAAFDYTKEKAVRVRLHADEQVETNRILRTYDAVYTANMEDAMKSRDLKYEPKALELVAPEDQDLFVETFKRRFKNKLKIEKLQALKQRQIAKAKANKAMIVAATSDVVVKQQQQQQQNASQASTSLQTEVLP